MSDRRYSRTVFAILVITSLVLLSFDYRQQDEGWVASLQRGALAVFSPVQEGFSTVVRPIGGFFGAVGQLGSLRDRVSALEEDNNRLREQLSSQADLARENEELRGLLAMSTRMGFRTTAARVIAQPPGSFEFSVLIDAGADRGLRPGMAVISPDGLIGKLTEVTRSNARVQLLTSPNARYAVRVAETGDDGLLRGRSAQPFELTVLNPESEIPDGAEVVTRAFTGSAIPDGVPIGIVEVERDRRRGARYLSVHPHVDFTRLNLVEIVLDAPLQPTELPSDELVEEPARPRPSADASPADGTAPAEQGSAPGDGT